MICLVMFHTFQEIASHLLKKLWTKDKQEKGQTNKEEKRQTDYRGLYIYPNKNSGYFNSCNLRCCLPQKLLQHPPPLHNLCTPLRQKCKKKSFLQINSNLSNFQSDNFHKNELCAKEFQFKQ